MLTLRLRQILMVATGLSVLLAVASYGAVETVAFSAISLIMHLGLLLAVTVFAIPRSTAFAIFVAVGTLMAVTAWVLLQTVPLPFGVFADHVWSAAPGLVQPVISVTPEDDRLALLKLCLPLSGFVLTLILFDTDERALAFLKVLAFGAAMIAALTLLQYLLAPGSLVLGRKLAYRDSFTGTFVNRNTAATFFGAALLCAAALTMRKASRIDWRRVRAALSLGAPLQSSLRRSLMKTGFIVLLSLVLLVALALTRSRAGISVSLVALAFYGWMSARRSLGPRFGSAFKARWGWRRIGVVSAGVIATAMVLALVLGQVSLRAEITTVADARFCMLPAILRSIDDHFPVGAGLAGFRLVFPAYRDPQCGVDFVWDMAHNVYLEGLLALGLLFPVLLVIVVVALMRIFARGRRTRKRYRFAPDLGLALLVLVLLHSGVDFSLQIPGFALYFACLLACLVTISSGGRYADGSPR